MNDRANIESLRIPPHSIEAEQAVLGGLMLRNSAWDAIGDLIVEADFYRADHRAIWRVIVGLIEDSKPADVLTIAEAMKGGDALNTAGGLAYLHQLAEATPSTANIRRYAEIVSKNAILRRLCEAGTEIADAAYERGRDAREVLDNAEKRILEIGHARARGAETFRGMTGLLTEAMSRLDEIHRNPASIRGKSTGFVDLDNETTGLQDGDLIIVAGRPSMGKTSLVLNFAEAIAIEQKLPVLIFSMEMSGTQLANRFVSSVARVDAQKFRTGRLDMVDWDRIGKGLGTLNESPIQVDESGALTVLEIRARARRKRRECGPLGLVVIDYLQLMTSAGSGRKETRAEELGEITRSLKLLAKELECPVVALSQLNRSLENRTNKRPVMSDLRESGALEQDADVILFIYRDEVYDSESPDKGLAEIIIGKQRNGPIGTVRLVFLPHFTRFENYAGGPTVRLPKMKPRPSFAEKD